MKYIISISLIAIAFVLNGQDAYKRQTQVDILRYTFEIVLNDESNQMEGQATVQLQFTAEPTSFSLDLIEKSGEFGMSITKVLENDKDVKYVFTDNKITITPNDGSSLERNYKIYYSGIAERGLVISTTKFGQRSFFGDNWPTLARHWLPCIDHPYDKAAVDFIVTAPQHYDVIATGVKKEETSLGNGMKLTHYSEDAPVPMKVITIGVTKFASKYLGKVGNVPISAWVYPENRLEGFYDFQVAVDVMTYYISHIGPYSYGKLANMQAKTQWGGLENAGAIAYNENSVTGENKSVGLVAHEIAHQWFGNSASENDWNHVWLSEGFATYFTMLYKEYAYGAAIRDKDLMGARKSIISYYKKNPSSIVDLSIREPMKVLTTNSYQKGGWFLHMLRNRLGDDVFWNGIREYYATYMNGNAMTSDLQAVMENVSGQDLGAFFEQWVFAKGYPELDYSWKSRKGKLTLNISQVQKQKVFRFPLEFSVTMSDGTSMSFTESITSASQTVEVEVKKGKVTSVVLDPDVKLLYEDVRVKK